MVAVLPQTENELFENNVLFTVESVCYPLSCLGFFPQSSRYAEADLFMAPFLYDLDLWQTCPDCSLPHPKCLLSMIFLFQNLK